MKITRQEASLTNYAQMRPRGSILMFSIAILLVIAITWKYENKKHASKSFPTLETGIYLGNLGFQDDSDFKSWPILILNHDSVNNSLLWSQNQTESLAVTGNVDRQGRLAFSSLDNKPIARLWGDGENGYYSGTAYIAPGKYGRWDIRSIKKDLPQPVPDETASLNFEVDFWWRELRLLRIAENDLQTNSVHLNRLKELSDEIDHVLAKLPAGKRSGAEETDETSSLLQARKVTLLADPRGQIAELERRIAERELQWILNRWDGYAPADDTSFTLPEGMTMEEIEARYKKSRDVTLLNNRIAQERAAISQLEISLQNTQRAQTQKNPQQEHQSFWEKIFD
ncbi:MAG: hypothetical protein PHC51_09540 [bacterium]|nr:hypothetical protein [bacterium]